MSGHLDIHDEASTLTFAEPSEAPTWWPQLQEIAQRLGVAPSDKLPSSVFTISWHDEHYDGGAILLAFLDRLDRAMSL